MASPLLKDTTSQIKETVNDELSTDEYGAVGDSPAEKLSNAMSDAVGVTTEIVGTLSSIQSGRDLLNIGYGFLPPGLGTVPCFVDLALGATAYFALPENSADNDMLKKMRDAMMKPFKDAFSLLGDIILPGEGPDLLDQLDSFFSEMKDSLMNPFMLFLKTQGQMLSQTMNAMASQLDAGQSGSFFNDFKNNVLQSLQKLFLGPDAEGNLLGIFIYAFEYGIPAIDSELYALRRLKKLSIDIAESASKAPIKIDVTLPNAATVLDLCEAEEALRIAYEKITKNDVLDRSMLGYASDKICEAQKIIYDGDMDIGKTALGHLSNFTGIQSLSYKAGDVGMTHMLPAATYKMKIDAIMRLAQQVKNQDDQIVMLYSNIVSAVDNIKAMTNVHIGKLLGPLILMVKNAVSGVRRDLELTGSGATSLPEFTYNEPVFDDAGNQIGTNSVKTTDVTKYKDFMANYITDKYGELPEAEMRKRVDAEVQKYYQKADDRFDVWSYMSSQAAAYMWLTILCRVMQLLPGTFNFIDRILAGQGAVMRVIMAVVERFDAGQCAGTTDPKRGGQRIIAQVNDLMRASQNRIAGLPGAQQEIAIAIKELRLAISDRQKFLVCMKQHMFFGLEQLMAVFSAISNAVALYQNLKQILNTFANLKDAVMNLRLSDLLGDSSAIGLIIKGIKCLVANCDSPVLNTLSVEVLERIEPDASTQESKSTNMKSFDGAPRVAAKIEDNQRIAKIIKLIGMINDIMNMNFNDLCTDDEKAKKQSMKENLTEANTPVNASSQQFYQYDARQNQAKAFSSTVSKSP